MSENNSTIKDLDYQRNKLIKRESAKKGLRGKINAFCISCLYDAGCGGGSWRKQVEDCTSRDCPLYEVRPVSETYVKPPKQGDLSNASGDLS